MNDFRIERDSMGELKVPASALWGAQTQRAVENFPISGMTVPRAFIEALGTIKASAAEVNQRLGLLDETRARAIISASEAVASGEYDEHFPVDVFQTGSGTSTNMNANEVIARLASEYSGLDVHPNDHVNMCASSNDTIPTAIHVSASLQIKSQLLPALAHLSRTIRRKGQRLKRVTKTGRTHLMDAMPIRFDQELGGWAQQIDNGVARIRACLPRLHVIAQGGTAVGTGINAHPQFGRRFASTLSRRTGIRFSTSPDYFESLSSQDTAVEVSGALRGIAVSLNKIANDIRWMNSGPLAGLGEIRLPALQPGSSIMPGKVNPVIAEATIMVSAQVIGNDATIAFSGASGNFQLNVMLPIIVYNILQSIGLLANVCRLLADKGISGFEVDQARLQEALSRNPVLITAANAVIGYERGAAIAKKAYEEGRSVIAVASEQTGLSTDKLEELLDPVALTLGGIHK